MATSDISTRSPLCTFSRGLLALRFQDILMMHRAGAARHSWLLLLVISFCVARGRLAAIAVTRAPGTTFQECVHCPQMRVVPGGRFTVTRKLAMDGQDGFPPSLRPPQPPRDAMIAKAFAIGVYDITREEYARFVARQRLVRFKGMLSLDP